MQELIDFLEKKGFTAEANSLKNGCTSLDYNGLKNQDKKIIENVHRTVSN